MKNIKSLLSLFVILSIVSLVAGACGGDDEPENESPVITDQSFSVAEDIDDEVIIGLVQANDPNGDDISFSITATVEIGGSRDFTGLFEIDEATGALSLASGQSLDFEDASGFSVTVSVSDMKLATTASVAIVVTDVDENVAPVISDQTFSAAEDIGDDVIIGEVQASDPNGNALSFSITATVELNGSRDFIGLFEIDEATGELSLASGRFLDFEDATGFSVTVSVSNMVLTSTASITVTVTDVEEVASHVAFITTWRTTEVNERISLLTYGNMTYYYNIDWGDGTKQSNQTGQPSHSYANPGDYQIAITGTFPGFSTNGAQQIISIDQWGTIEWETMASAFSGSPNVLENASDAPDLSRVTNMSRMFYNCKNFNGDLNNWDVSNVTDMNTMFEGATQFSGDIGDWDVSNVTDMSRMFRVLGYFNYSSFRGEIGGWDVGNVTNMSEMFRGARYFNEDIGDWDVSNVTNMRSMFSDTEYFNQDIGGWDVSKVTNMRLMFNNSIFNQEIGSWDVSNVTDMSFMFRDAPNFNGDIGDWDVSNVINMTAMFTMPYEKPSQFNQDIGRWNVSNVKYMAGMFSGATSFNQDLTQWDVAAVMDCSGFSMDSGLAVAFYPNFTNCNPN